MLTPVAEGVWTHRSELLRNNTVVVRGRDGVLLVDPGLTRSEMACLASDLREAALSAVAGFATHPDWDHVLWHADLGEPPRYGTERCAAFMKDVRSEPGWKAVAEKGLPAEIAGEVPLELYGLITALPDGTAHIPWDGPKVRILEHRAHAPGHAALLVEEHGVLIAGDMLSDVFVPMLDTWTDTNDPIEEYLAGLRLLETVADAEFVVPGHGTVGGPGEARARIERDRAYLLAVHDGHTVDDPRVTTPEPGWEWVSDIHQGQLRALAERTGAARR